MGFCFRVGDRGMEAESLFQAFCLQLTHLWLSTWNHSNCKYSVRRALATCLAIDNNTNVSLFNRRYKSDGILFAHHGQRSTTVCKLWHSCRSVRIYRTEVKTNTFDSSLQLFSYPWMYFVSLPYGKVPLFKNKSAEKCLWESHQESPAEMSTKLDGYGNFIVNLVLRDIRSNLCIY